MKGKLVLAILIMASFSLQANEHHGWGYEGKEAPENWGKLSPEFHMCQDGQNQSPVDIHGALHSNLAPLVVQYITEPQNIINNGHTLQINVAKGDTIEIDGELFTLQQFHFHVPSENEINGQQFPLEAHLVHMNDQGELLVVAVMFNVGAANPELNKAWGQIPEKLNQQVALKEALNLNALLPTDKHYYRFSGSLTTPPCSEGVRWLVMKNPLTVSAEQITQFKSAIHHDANNRPIQQYHGRVIVD
ncbi:carbonic anhydrase [Yersinia alsatica]|uniref:carbonic anhydrase n=1 Tax=Yersinia alsatica TaxID=2890317 RepID=UPI0011A8D400|nr:carbonic anhydrase family protein [Yersinia alsatica]